ncbi:MAG: hypothetical protein Q7S22_08835 [Candidatus Micrarchaeota archaeon]|nr:hypothetical protein [Candidatus Micrarchaeota archaeon]
MKTNSFVRNAKRIAIATVIGTFLSVAPLISRAQDNDHGNSKPTSTENKDKRIIIAAPLESWKVFAEIMKKLKEKLDKHLDATSEITEFLQSICSVGLIDGLDPKSSSQEQVRTLQQFLVSKGHAIEVNGSMNIETLDTFTKYLDREIYVKIPANEMRNRISGKPVFCEYVLVTSGIVDEYLESLKCEKPKPYDNGSMCTQTVPIFFGNGCAINGYAHEFRLLESTRTSYVNMAHERTENGTLSDGFDHGLQLPGHFASYRKQFEFRLNGSSEQSSVNPLNSDITFLWSPTYSEKYESALFLLGKYRFWQLLTDMHGNHRDVAEYRLVHTPEVGIGVNLGDKFTLETVGGMRFSDNIATTFDKVVNRGSRASTNGKKLEGEARFEWLPLGWFALQGQASTNTAIGASGSANFAFELPHAWKIMSNNLGPLELEVNGRWNRLSYMLADLTNTTNDKLLVTSQLFGPTVFINSGVTRDYFLDFKYGIGPYVSHTFDSTELQGNTGRNNLTFGAVIDLFSTTRVRATVGYTPEFGIFNGSMNNSLFVGITVNGQSPLSNGSPVGGIAEIKFDKNRNSQMVDIAGTRQPKLEYCK